MRPSLLPGLLVAAQRNADRGFPDIAIFEVGQVYRGISPEDQLTAAAGLRTGAAGINGTGRHWSTSVQPVSAFDAKSDALAVLHSLSLAAERVDVASEAPEWFHPARSGTLRLGPGKILGWFGELHPKALEALGADGPVAAFELILPSIPAPRSKPTRTKPPLELSALQAVRRDFAFIVDRGVEAARIVKAARGADRKLVQEVSVFDVFEGDAIGREKKSVAIEVTIQPRERTLTDAEIDAVTGRIVAEVTGSTGAVLRS
jgi:phenylalanyl-tRNA synthetase beta chain